VRPDLPSGTVTFLFTDVEGSTRLLDELGAERYAEALGEHRRVVRGAFARHGGVEVDTQGDAFFYAFATASGAVSAAKEATEALASGPIRMRVGLHTGTPFLTGEGYVGQDVHRAARIAAAAHGGQVVLSHVTRAHLGDGSALRDLGEHRFKDLAAAERVYQLGDGEFPPLQSLYRTNLPIPASSFLGRDRELGELVELLSGDDLRLVTLTGPGGTGKTRLALQAAVEASDAFPDGLFWVSLASLRDPGLALSALAQALEVKEEPGRELAELLLERVGGKKALVLLDNAEHLLPDLARDLSPLVRNSGTVTWLVTSRERLQLTGEHTYPVPTLEERTGLELFLERAAAAGSPLAATDAVREICSRLDHLPLALELAAARTTLFTPEQLLDRLSQGLDLLKGGRDVDPRQRTLRATIEWSYDLLGEREKRLFRRLSVFAGGCTFEATEEVCEADPDTLQSVLDKSLVRRDPATEPRFSLLETIGNFAAEKLEELGETQEQAGRHARHYLALAEDAAPNLTGRERLAWLGRLEEEHDNLRAALAFASENDIEVLVRLVAALMRFWEERGHFSEGIRWARRAVEHEAGSAELCARAHFTLGFLAYSGSDLAESLRHLERAAELQRAHGDNRALGECLVELAWTRWACGDEERARALGASGLELAREHGNRRYVALAMQLLAAMSESQQAAELLTEAVSIFRDLGDQAAAVRAESVLGWCEAVEGRYARAREIFRETLRAAESSGDILQAAGDRGNLGLAELLDGDPAAAAENFLAELEASGSLHNGRLAGEALCGLAGVFALRDEPRVAARLLGAAAALYERLGTAPSALDRTVEEQLVRPAATDPDTFAADVAQGRTMTEADATNYVLNQLSAAEASS